ncbi:barstar family protein [Brevibacillus sp. SYSU BS000544]|uniref:barstar family protein n=1 Tax=Brevibacillus sp. SYSU BS000544 TaxID=3416443 RepID=UPI003CE57667
MNIGYEAKVCHIGFSIGYFTKEYIISWADKVITILESSDIPEIVFDLSMVKKVEDIPEMLHRLSHRIDQEEALKIIVEMIHQNYKNKQLSLHETCEFLYRLSNHVDPHHKWNDYLYVITGNLEVALDGYGDVDASIAEIEEFFKENGKNSECFDLNYVPNKPTLIELKLRKDHVIIDVSKVFAISDLQLMLKNGLDFPDFYGMNWNAFWDAITGLVKMPRKLTFTQWGVLENRFSEEAKILETLLNKYSQSHPNDNFIVVYKR